MGISKGNETEPDAVLAGTEPDAVLSAQLGDTPGPAGPALAGGMGALGVARRVPGGRTYLPWGMLAAIDPARLRAEPGSKTPTRCVASYRT